MKLVNTVLALEEGDEIRINSRVTPLTVTSIEKSEYEPIKLTIVHLEGPRGGIYAIKHMAQRDKPDDVGLMRYHTTRGKWVNASEGLVQIERV